MLVYCAAERETVNAAERAERKLQLRDKVSVAFSWLFFFTGIKKWLLIMFCVIMAASCNMGLTGYFVRLPH